VTPDSPDVARLVRSLALSDRFRFYLLVVEAPEAARAVAAILEHEVAAAREAPVHVVWLDPYDDRAEGSAPMPWRRLVDAVLAPLLEPSAELSSPEAIVIADAARAPAADEDAWRILFQRMNERRNAVAGALRGALVLALPPALERVFAHAAPDFWSIRSLSIVV
jgi:hypothetical protein